MDGWNGVVQQIPPRQNRSWHAVARACPEAPGNFTASGLRETDLPAGTRRPGCGSGHWM